jgi:hypothetical protein
MTDDGGNELAASFLTVRANTIQIAEEIPESNDDFSAAPGCRSVGRTLAHIAIASGFQMHTHSSTIDDLKSTRRTLTRKFQDRMVQNQQAQSQQAQR